MSTYAALASAVAGRSLNHVVIATMDDHVVPDCAGFRWVAPDLPYSCERASDGWRWSPG